MSKLPRSGRFPSAFDSQQQAWLRVSNRDPATEQMVVSGPFLTTLVPTGGSVQMPDPRNAGQMVVIDMRARVPESCDARARAIVTDVARGTQYFVVYVGSWSGGNELYLVRQSAK